MSDNPFQSPSGQPSRGYPTQGGPHDFGRGYLKQVPVIASLMIAQGVLLIIFALAMIGYTFLFSRFDSWIPDDTNARTREIIGMQMSIMRIVFGVESACAGVLGVMHFVAAYFGFDFQYRAFGIATMILGFCSLLTLYCAPTAIGLGVYGLIVCFNPAVVRAFELRKAGMSKQEMLAEFPY